MKIATQGLKYIIPPLGLAFLLSFYPPARPFAALCFVLGLAVTFFFRDPERIPPDDPNLLVSPADGKVVHVGPDGSGRTRVSIFLSLFSVHINRSPISGLIEGLKYTPGRFLPAYRSEASARNEQNEVVIGDGSFHVTVRQIAGVVARRIVCYKKVDDTLERGERFGLIQFGSRVDVFLSSDVKVRLSVGDKVKGGESVLGERV
jgi:phosphatidylserine decarboxylase